MNNWFQDAETIATNIIPEIIISRRIQTSEASRNTPTHTAWYLKCKHLILTIFNSGDVHRKKKNTLERCHKHKVCRSMHTLIITMDIVEN